MNNIFVVFDGIDGCGKSTQLSKLHDYLFKKDKRIRILSTREPTYGRYGKQVRAMLIANEDPYSDSDILLNLYVKDREDHLENTVKPFLLKRDDNVSVVLSDRYYYSTIVYQHVQGVDLKKVVELNKDFRSPDLALILDLNPEIALKRIADERTTEKFEQLEFLKKLRQNFLKLKDILQDNIRYIDSSGTEQETFEKIKKEIDRIL